VRYLLPVVALGLLGAAAGASVLWHQRHRVALIGVALAAQFGLLVGSAPHSLAWTSLPTDAPWRLAADSNLEWGQDFYRLQDWARGRPLWLAWTGPMPSALVPGARPLTSVEPEKVSGWVAVNATTLTVYGHEELAWLRAYCPVDDLGGTVLLYRFDDPPSSERGPETPPEECRGEVSVRVA
jgi:hypothetical protein